MAFGPKLLSSGLGLGWLVAAASASFIIPLLRHHTAEVQLFRHDFIFAADVLQPLLFLGAISVDVGKGIDIPETTPDTSPVSPLLGAGE